MSVTDWAMLKGWWVIYSCPHKHLNRIYDKLGSVLLNSYLFFIFLLLLVYKREKKLLIGSRWALTFLVLDVGVGSTSEQLQRTLLLATIGCWVQRGVTQQIYAVNVWRLFPAELQQTQRSSTGKLSVGPVGLYHSAKGVYVVKVVHLYSYCS